MHTALSNSIPEDPLQRQYDSQGKKVLANKYILAYILQRIAPEVQGMSINEIIDCIEGHPKVENVRVLDSADLIDGNNVEDKYVNEGTLYYDIRFYVYLDQGSPTKILFDVEPQKNFYPGYQIPTRGIVYCARMISSQIERDFSLPHYDDLKKVYSIWICFNAPKYIGNAISCYQITKQDLVPGIPDNSEAYDKLCVVQICLREDSEEHDVLTDLLNTLFSTTLSASTIKKELSTRYFIPMDTGYGEEIDHMSNLGAMILQRGEAKGETRLARLIDYLISHGQNDDIKKAVRDENARKEMYKKYNIID